MAKLDRKKELSGDADIKEQCVKLYDAIYKGFDDQRERADQTLDMWEIYNCQLGRFQNYSSNMSQVFVPIVRNAVTALVTRYINQAFPSSGRHVEAVTGEQDQPYATLSLIEHYISRAKLRTQAAVEILVNGQVEGQYNAYFHWDRTERTVVSRSKEPIKVDGQEMEEAGEVETISEEVIEDSLPVIEVLHDSDVLVIPATASSVEAALEQGGAVTVVRRWSEATIQKMADDEEIGQEEADELIEKIGQGGDDAQVRDTAKTLAWAAGIHYSGKKVTAIIWETWAKIEVKGERRLCRIFYTDEKRAAGCRLNPYWNDRCPVRSAPVKKLPGVFKGESPISACATLQYQSNDFINEAGDMMYLTLAPGVMVDPERVSKWKELVVDVGSVWPVHPDAVKMFEWPNKVREAYESVSANKAMIFETIGVNPGMLPQQTGTKAGKRNQAEIALEQQVDLLTTADAVTVLEQEILTPYVQWAAELDHQFREESILVREFGELGLRASMEEIEPIQWQKRWELKWSGVEVARNAANLQQQIAWVNVVKGIPPQQYMGYRLDLAPVLEVSAGMVFGSRLGRLTFKNMRDEQSVDPEVENGMLEHGFEVLTHAQDDDPGHLQAHMRGMQKAMATGNQQVVQAYRAHIAMHQRALQLKQQAQAAAASQGQQPGADGAGARRQPRSGAQPGVPRQAAGPPGLIRPDSMPKAGSVGMPRRM